MTRKQKKLLARILIASALMIINAFLPIRDIARFVAYLVPYLVIGYDILIKAGRGILNRQVFDENFLMAIATIGAMIIGITDSGDYVEAIAVMLFYQIGELFQSYAVGKSRKNISSLMDIRPDYANIELNGRLEQVGPDEVQIGDLIIVRPGEKVPIDGVIAEGSSTLNTSALTGESVPVDVKEGDRIISGCINMSGLLKIRTDRAFGESTVSKILDLVENASSRKSKSEAFISKFAKIYTPVVCISALTLAIVPPIFCVFVLKIDANLSEWIYRALTFLVASCPCALVISIPLSFFAGIGGAGKEGILVKGSNYLERLSKTGYVVFDKTGTLTQGVFEITDIKSNTISESELLEYAAYAESSSMHPIAQSIRRAYGQELDLARISLLEEISGNGIIAKIDGVRVEIGNGKLMEKLGIKYEECQSSGTVVYIGINGKYAGYIVISDLIKATSASAISSLKRIGIKKTVMLTGDRTEVACVVAGQLKIDEVYSELLPADKVRKVEELIEEKPQNLKLAFVGDGINDSPVLARADIGIAMGSMGSDAAIEAADVVLMDDDPSKLVKAIKIARKCLGIVYQNIVFAIGVKILSLVLVAFGFAGMWIAIFADVGVMILAVLNAIRALFVKKL